jgi:recombination protein RecT
MQNGNGQLASMAPLEKLKTSLEAARDKLAEVAPKYMDVGRLVRLMLLACGRSPKILTCSPTSILQFAMKCAETGLEPIGAGGCWPIPYENRKAGTVELQFIPDYRGLVHCAVRSGAIKAAFAEIVRAADQFDYELGLAPSLTHKPARGERGELEAAYCVFDMPDGSRRFAVMDGHEIKAIRARSRASGSGPWVTDEAEMWKKTVIRRAMKPFAGLSSSLDTALDADEFVPAEEREPVKMPLALGEVPPEPEAAVRRGRPRKEKSPEQAAEPIPESLDDAGPIPEAGGMDTWAQQGPPK